MASHGHRLFADVCISLERRSDGALIMTNQLAPSESVSVLPEKLRRWSRETPDRCFLSEGSTTGRRFLSYGEAEAIVARWAPRLLGFGLTIDRPLVILGGNSIHHALLMLTAQTIGLPVAVVTPNYANRSAAPYHKFERVMQTLTPGLLVADAPSDVSMAAGAVGLSEVSVVPLGNMAWLEGAPPAGTAALDRAIADVTLDTVAKFLFTSGSTGPPKAVINTQRMMATNMDATAVVWPFLKHVPPVLVDWLPWSHTFGGNFCFNLCLFFGGTMHIDAGRPGPVGVQATLQTLREIKPTLYFNVPAGYDALASGLEGDLELAKGFFDQVAFLFNAGAGLPAPLRRRLEALSERVSGTATPVIGAWGATETAPSCTTIYFDTPHAANLGLPLPGVEIKLKPYNSCYELLVRGPNVTPGYWRQPEATASSFDDEGFYRIGDLARFADPEAPEAGLLFDGRSSENFKLASGTWVNVGSLRLAVIAACRPLVSDVVVTGENRDGIGLLIFLDETATRSALRERHGTQIESDLHSHPAVTREVKRLIDGYNAGQIGSSTQISTFSIQAEPPQAVHDEITEKGYINQRAVLRRRKVEVEKLYSNPVGAPDG